MSTTNFYDIPDFLKEKLNTSQDTIEEAMLRRPNPNCFDGNCPPPPPMPCKNGNCPPNRPPYPQYPFHPCQMGGPCKKKNIWMTPTPYHRAYPGSLRLQEEMYDWQDLDNLRERYPKNAKIIKDLVDEHADRMDYDGSMMFDEYPDEIRIEKIVEDIYKRLLSELQNDMDSEPAENSQNMSDGKEMFAETCVRCENPIEEDVLKELIMVLLYQEMYQRRCKNRRCNRWW